MSRDLLKIWIDNLLDSEWKCPTKAEFLALCREEMALTTALIILHENKSSDIIFIKNELLSLSKSFNLTDVQFANVCLKTLAKFHHSLEEVNHESVQICELGST